jgi:hypothetical protein
MLSHSSFLLEWRGESKTPHVCSGYSVKP